MPTELLSERQGATLVLTLSDPATRNALSREVYARGAELVQQAADDRSLAALDDAEHLSFRAPLAIEARDTHLDAVTVHHRSHFLRGQVDGRLPVIGVDEAMAIAVALHRALDLTHQGGGVRNSFCHGRHFDAIVAASADDSTEDNSRM